MKGGLANAIKIFREKNPEFFVNNFLYSSSDFACLINSKCHYFVIYTNSHHLWFVLKKKTNGIPLTSFSNKSSRYPNTQEYHVFHFTYTLKKKKLTEMFSQTATQYYILSKRITKKTTPSSQCMTRFPTRALLY